MDERMNQVAESGDITALHQLIRMNVNLLDRIDQVPFVQTPLHIAASAGHIQFAMEMMGLKPSFARKLNLDWFSPIHLSLQYGHIELVHRLLQIDGDLVRVKGREQRTPLHYVVESGEHLYLLEEFLLVCPNSITDVTTRNETALHIALRNDNLEAFKFFVGWLISNSSKIAKFNQRRALNWKDNEGNTVLHILVSRNQTEDVRHFLSWCKEFVDVNVKNLEDNTAWDILREDNEEIRDMLSHAGAKPGSSLTRSTSNGYPNQKYQRLPSTVAFRPRDFRREITEEERNMFLVVAALLVTLSFQAVLTPTGGVWQDNGLCITTEPGSSYHQFSPFNFFKKISPSNKTVGSSNYPKIIYLSQSNTTLACEHKAGTAIAFEDRFFLPFLACNTVLFLFSMSLIVILIPNVSIIKFLFFPLKVYLCLSYIYSVWTITDDRSVVNLLIFGVGIYFVFIELFSCIQLVQFFFGRVRLSGLRILSWCKN